MRVCPKSEFGVIMVFMLSVNAISSIIIRPTLSRILAMLLLDGIIFILIWGFDSDIARLEKRLECKQKLLEMTNENRNLRSENMKKRKHSICHIRKKREVEA